MIASPAAGQQRRTQSWWQLAALLCLTCTGAGCDGNKVTGTWRPGDHDQPPRENQQQAAATPPRGAAPDTLVTFTWEQQCAQCHGLEGRGDGPQAPVNRPPDLTRPAWQDAVSDDLIALTITQGRGKMPPFDLPPRTLQGLVKKVRSLRAGGR